VAGHSKTRAQLGAKRSTAARAKVVELRGTELRRNDLRGKKKPATVRLMIALCAALAMVTVALYSPVGRHPFIDYDDQSYVTGNPHVQAGLTWDTVTWAVTSTEASNWHPVTWLSHAADCELFGLNPSGHHWHSVLIHALNIILLFLLLHRATRATWQSLLVAALFALHPLNVESVAWIAERKNLLSTTFFFLALGAYGWYAQKPSARRYAAVAALFVLGLASKPMVITLPFVLLLLDYWPLGRIEGWTQPSETFAVPQAPPGRLVLEKLPLLALSAASAVVTIVAQSVAEVPGQALPLEVRLPASLYAYGMYIWKMFWPLHLALIYPHPGRTLGWWKPLLAGLLMIGISIAVWRQRRQRPYLAVGWLWFLGTAVPIIGIMQVGVQVVADRYAYLPLIGIFVMVVWGLSSLADGLRLGRLPRAATAVLVLAALSFATWRQIGYWRSTIDLWSHAVQVTENNSMAEEFLSNALFTDGQYDEAMTHLRRYAALEPLDPLAHVRVGADSQDHDQYPEAIREYETAIRGAAVLANYGRPGFDSRMLAMTYANLGLIYRQMGDETETADNARKALSTDSEAVVQMVQDLGQAVAAHPSAAGYVRLGLLLTLVGHPAEAQQAFARAQQVDAGVALPPGVEVGSVRR